ncbi:2-phospho-L-lactate guanylyltransferase [Natrarchaeobius chitinivorans]|uniref:2-phospho-L-lactate guanylyltransferase n=1 Tax=Natrarchaeobius chitinivorans TaxID=1679083 RepID=A0A3N6MTA8_NATCH|nr:2-phospho-L-lactate guanylyltransferase [Natrarchaeobius chitinivorans]RQG98026.1 2-phospho-L-lactate guanylyltransferase [Natrarchaeobius chitinivorans]
MEVVVPFAAETPKTRLGDVLTSSERSTFARAMLADVLAAIDETGHEPTVLSTATLPFEDELASVPPSASVAVDTRSLTDAVDARLPDEGDDPVAVVMADLALATPDALEALFATDADVAIAPGRGGGTNALVVDHPEFRVDYHGMSYLDHRAIAREAGASLAAVDSFRLGTDVDEPEDLVEVLVHGTGRSPARLREFGFRLADESGRVGVVRDGESTLES